MTRSTPSLITSNPLILCRSKCLHKIISGLAVVTTVMYYVSTLIACSVHNQSSELRFSMFSQAAERERIWEKSGKAMKYEVHTSFHFRTKARLSHLTVFVSFFLIVFNQQNVTFIISFKMSCPSLLSSLQFLSC